MSLRRMLLIGMAQDAKQRKQAKLKQKYSAAPPAMQEAMADEDEATENASLPKATKKMSPDAQTMIEGMKDVNETAEQGTDDYKKALSAFDDDEELKKYLASK